MRWFKNLFKSRGKTLNTRVEESTKGRARTSIHANSPVIQQEGGSWLPWAIIATGNQPSVNCEDASDKGGHSSYSSSYHHEPSYGGDHSSGSYSDSGSGSSCGGSD